MSSRLLYFENALSSPFLELSYRFLLKIITNFFGRFHKWVSSHTRQKEMGFGDDGKPRIYENIGPTAALVAHYRAFSDIPFAKQFAEGIDAVGLSKGMNVDDPVTLARARVAFEARFKSVDAVLKLYREITRYIEIPSGFSTRGLTMTKNRNVSFVECDLSPVLKVKQKLVADILCRLDESERNNLHFQVGSILNAEELHTSLCRLPNGAVGVITEGLLSYLTRKEKTIAAQNIYRLLAQRGGVWVVTDLTRLFKPRDPNAAELRGRIETSTGFNPITGCFASVSEAKDFFESNGFVVHEHRRSEVIDSLSTIKSSNLGMREVRKLLEEQATFALEIG